MAGVFPTAASPTAFTPPPAAQPPGVGTFPTIAFGNEFVKVRWFEPNVPEAVNRRWIGMPRGVYLGFIPSTTPGSRVVTLATDPGQNFSLVRVPSSDDRVMVDIFTGDDLELDFTAHNTWPVYVLASSTFRVGSPTQGKIFTRGANANGIDEVVLCKIDKVGPDLVIDITEPTNRQQPVAFESQPYGYMPDGAIEALDTTNATVLEVIAARSSSYTGGHGSLKARLDADMEGAAMADRLGLRHSHLISNVHPSRSGSSLNVSGSFTETGREFAPNFTITAGGSESTEGAITSGGRNICFIINGTTGQRLTDEVSREPIYGRLTFSAASLSGSKEIHFVNASVSVDGNGTNPFVPPIEDGDIVVGPDGLFYEIENIIDPDNATLGAAYRGADDFITNPAFRRWLVFLFTVGGGVYNLTTPTAVQFIFPTFWRIDRAIYDGFLLIKKDGERTQLPIATDSVAGKALLAISGGLVGSFKTVKNAGTSVGSDTHTLNFVNGGATNAGSGVVAVSVPGATGPTGPSANTGGPGPTGADGFGYSTNNTFEPGPETIDTVTAGADVSQSFTNDWTSTVPALGALLPRSYAHVSGGWSVINGFWPGGYERIGIVSLQNIDSNSTRIIYNILRQAAQSFTTIQCYMGASQ